MAMPSIMQSHLAERNNRLKNSIPESRFLRFSKNILTMTLRHLVRWSQKSERRGSREAEGNM